MTINNFYYNYEPQDQPLDLRTTNVENNSSLVTTGRVLIDAMNALVSYHPEVGMEICEPPISAAIIPGLRSHLPSIFEDNLRVTNNPIFRKDARLLELRKEIIGFEKKDSQGNIISLNFSKRFIHKRFLIEEILARLDQIYDKKNIYNTVKKITLKSNKLVQLPRSILKFTNLKWIDLSGNRFTTIPAEICSFKNLKRLSLANNLISYVPKQIGRLKHLEEINLSGNKIQHLHRSLFLLKKLLTLNLAENSLDDIPKWINKLENLECLNVSSNNLFHIPAEIFGKNLEYLDLSNNHIDAIPTAIKNSLNLLDINFDNNEIVNIPDEIGDLSHLTAVSLNENTTLRGFSENLYNLLPSCTVEIDNSGIALSTLSEIQAKSAEMDYDGPSFDFSMADAEERIENRLVESLYVHTHRNPPKAFKNLRCMSDHLEMWLNRLDWMSDFQHLSNNSNLPESIIDCIEYAEVNPQYYKLFENIVQGATATCGDGVALSIIDIGIAKEVLSFIESNQIVELSHFLLGTALPRQILQKIAGQKITLLKLEAKQKEKVRYNTTFLIDDVEVYLAYPILLKTRLNLAININSMVTERATTGVTEHDLEVAVLEVRKQQADKQACAEFLVTNTYWLELVKKLHPQKYEEIHEQSIEMMDDCQEAAEEYRRNALIALSGISL